MVNSEYLSAIHAHQAYYTDVDTILFMIHKLAAIDHVVGTSP